VSPNPTGDFRTAQVVAGLRAFAEFLEQHPQVPVSTQRVQLPLTTNDAVTAFAAEHGLTVNYDDEGNGSCNILFGLITLHAYGYADFAKHCEKNDERNARKWAKNNGLEFVAAGGAQ
jgi:hypothetical protein